MKRLAAIAALIVVLVGCKDATTSEASVGLGEIAIWHDKQRAVTCWVYKGYQKGGISCIPDDQLQGGAK